MTLLGKILDAFLNLLAVLAGILLILVMLASVIKVGLRYLFNYGILGVDQLSGSMLVFITFLGAAWVLRREGHVTVDILLGLIPAPAARIFHIVASLVGAAVCLTLTYYAYGAVSLSIQRGVMVAAEVEFPRAITLSVIPLGCALLGIEFLRRALRFYSSPELPTAHTIEGA